METYLKRSAPNKVTPVPSVFEKYRILIIYLIAINLISFLAFGIDKKLAKMGARRISEASLMSLSLIGGGLGALLGMYIFRHKTKHIKFTLGIPFILLLEIVIIFFVLKK